MLKDFIREVPYMIMLAAMAWALMVGTLHVFNWMVGA